MAAPRDRAHAPLDSAQIAQAKAAVLALYREGWSPGYAAAQVGVTRRTLYHWREADPEFATDWHDAYQHGGDWYEDQLRENAAKGKEISCIVGLKIRKRFIEKEAADPERLAEAILSSMRQIVATQRAQLASGTPVAEVPAADTADKIPKL